MSEEERTKKIEDAEKVQNESAAQVQASSAAKNQSEDEIKKKAEFEKQVSTLRDELQVLKEMVILTDELESLKNLNRNDEMFLRFMKQNLQTLNRYKGMISE